MALRPAGERSYLALEDDLGQTRPAGIDELQPHLTAARDLRLVVLSGCQTGQTSDRDAFRGVAAGLLKLDVPAVVAMQFAILDNSAIKLAGAFYSAWPAEKRPPPPCKPPASPSGKTPTAPATIGASPPSTSGPPICG
jgi:CHAT domain-containing protein